MAFDFLEGSEGKLEMDAEELRAYRLMRLGHFIAGIAEVLRWNDRQLPDARQFFENIRDMSKDDFLYLMINAESVVAGTRSPELLRRNEELSPQERVDIINKERDAHNQFIAGTATKH